MNILHPNLLLVAMSTSTLRFLDGHSYLNAFVWDLETFCFWLGDRIITIKDTSKEASGDIDLFHTKDLLSNMDGDFAKDYCSIIGMVSVSGGFKFVRDSFGKDNNEIITTMDTRGIEFSVSITKHDWLVSTIEHMTIMQNMVNHFKDSTNFKLSVDGNTLLLKYKKTPTSPNIDDKLIETNVRGILNHYIKNRIMEPTSSFFDLPLQELERNLRISSKDSVCDIHFISLKKQMALNFQIKFKVV
tara:strand:- start:238983 stop:239714 length:732 start_codon:yes stop_codon:yes gene_type:complete